MLTPDTDAHPVYSSIKPNGLGLFLENGLADLIDGDLSVLACVPLAAALLLREDVAVRHVDDLVDIISLEHGEGFLDDQMRLVG